MEELMSVMNRRPEKELFEEVALLKNIDPSFIEKDLFVTQVIAVLADLNADGFEFVFTGGTALSKAYNFIQRFSEDARKALIPALRHNAHVQITRNPVPLGLMVP
jgi:hypothetical protein